MGASIEAEKSSAKLHVFYQAGKHVCFSHEDLASAFSYVPVRRTAVLLQSLIWLLPALRLCLKKMA
jgi:hypothetical protein